MRGRIPGWLGGWLLVGSALAQDGAYVGPRSLASTLGAGLCGCGLPEQASDPIQEGWSGSSGGHLQHTEGGQPWEAWWGWRRRELLPDPVREGLDDERLRTRVIPALLQVLEQEPTGIWAVHDAAGLALARVAARRPAWRDELRAPLKAWFTGSFSGVPRGAVALGMLADPRDLELLEALLHDEPAGRVAIQQARVYPTMRVHAAYALDAFRLSAGEAAPRLRLARGFARAMLHREPELLEVAIAATIGLGRCPLPVGESLPEKAPELAGIASLQDQLTWLLAGCDEEGDAPWPRGVRAHVPLALVGLLEHLPDEAPGHAALRERVEAHLVRTLRARPDEELRDLRYGAIAAAGRLRSPATAEALAFVVQRGSPVERPLAQLAGLGPAAQGGRTSPEAQLAAELGQGPPSRRSWTALATGVQGAQTGLRDVTRRALDRRAKRENDRVVRAAYALSYALMGSGGGAEEVADWMRAARREDPALGALGEALGAAGIEVARPALLAAFERSTDADELALLGWGLARLGRPEDAVRVQARLVDPRIRGAEAAIAEALGAFPSGVDVDGLCELLGDASRRQAVRAAAAAALGRVSVPGADRWSVDLRRSVPFPLRTPNQVNADGAGVLQWL